MPQEEQGFNPNRYQVIPRTLIFLFDGTRVLLIKGRADKKIWAGLYNGLGGHIEDGEDVLAAARRELAEESGVKDCPLWLSGVVSINLKPASGILLFVFKGEVRGQELIESREGTLEWVEAGEIDQLPVVDDLRIILPLIARWKAGDAQFYARYWYDETGRMRIEMRQPD